MGEASQARNLFDVKAKRTEYDEFEIGAEFTPAEIALTFEQIDFFCQGNHDYHEWYSVDSPLGGRICRESDRRHRERPGAPGRGKT